MSALPLSTILVDGQEIGREAAPTPELRRVMACLRTEIPLLKTVEELARVAGIGRRTLERRFRAAFGLSTQEIMRRMRVDYARQLLLGSDAKLEEIAEQSGFADGRMLGTAFRRVYGETPSAFRSRHSSE